MATKVNIAWTILISLDSNIIRELLIPFDTAYEKTHENYHCYCLCENPLKLKFSLLLELRQ